MLKTIGLLKKRIIALFRFGIFRYIKTKFGIIKLAYPIQELINECGDISNEVTRIYEGGAVEMLPPTFANAPEYIDLSVYDGKSSYPPVFLHVIRNAKVISRTEFILKNQTLYYPSLINPILDVFTAELEGNAFYLDEGDSLKISIIKGKKSVARAVSLFGQANGNYLHFLTETLSRLVAIDDSKLSFDVPLLIEDNLHPKLYEALSSLNVNDRPLIRVSPYEAVSVEELFYITPISYTPPETRSWYSKKIFAKARKEQFIFSREGLEALRSKVRDLSGKYILRIDEEVDRTAKTGGPTRLSHKKKKLYGENFYEKNGIIHNKDLKYAYLERQAASTGNGRLLRNQKQIKYLFIKKDFASYDISQFTFFEQASILDVIDIVVSPIGAALGNLLFSKPGKDVVILTPTYPGATFFYFANLMTIAGHRVHFILGKQIESTGHGIQAQYNHDYIVSPTELESVLNEIQRTRNR